MAKKPPTPQAQPSPSTDLNNEPQRDLRQEIERQIGPLVNQNQKGEIVMRMMRMVQEKFSGPIAHPRHLREYEEILPGSAERILKMAEKAQDHNADMDRLVVGAQVDDQKRGMRYGFWALMLILICAGFFGYRGEAVIAGLFLTTAVIGVIGVFVRGRFDKV